MLRSRSSTASGRNVTPAKASWKLDRSGGEWFLALDLDDAKLPLPYVIDPAVDYPATQYLRNTASTTQTAVPDYALETTAGTVNTTTVTITTGTATGFLQFRPQTTLWATKGAPSLAPPNGRGWIVDLDGAATPNDTVIPAGNWTFNVRTDANGTSTGGPMNMAFGVWKVTTAGGTIGASTMYVDPNAAGSLDTLSLLNTTATQTVNHVIALPEISLLPNEHIIVQLYGYNAAALTTSRTLSLYFNDANAYVQHTAATTRPSVPALVTPANAAFPNTTTPTLTATFSDPDAANTGTVNFRVCADAACTTVISTFSSAALLANGANGSAAVPGAAGLVNGTTYYWQAQNKDNSNVQSAFSASRSFTVDTTAPAVPSLVITESNADSHASGSTFYYRPAGAGGTFTATATTSDATSLVKHVTFPGLAGGFTPAAPANDTTPAYAQVYTWPATTGTETGAKNVTAEDNATNISTAGTFTVTPDSAVPVTGALTVNSVAASGGGTQSYDGDGAFTIGTRTDYTDAISGLATSTLTREQGTLERRRLLGLRRPDHARRHARPRADSQPAATATSSPAPTTSATRRSITTIVKVDTTAPAAPGLVLADSSADVFTTGTTAFYRPAGSGSFDVTASSTDAQSGILDYGFPVLAGFTGSGAAATRTYTLATPTEPNGVKPVTARNPALLSSAATNFTLTSDSVGPTGGALTVNTVAATGGGTQSYDGDGTFTIGIRTDYSADATSGLRDLRPDARAGHAQRRRLLGLRRPDHARRHPRPERPRHRLLPLRPHRHRQRRQHLDRHHRGQGRHDRAGSPGPGARRLQRRRLHHRHHRLLPPRRHRLLRRHRFVDRRAVRDPRLRLPGPRRLHRLRRRRHPHLHTGDADRAERRQARHRPQPGAAQLDRHQLHAHLRRCGADRRRADGQHASPPRGGGTQSYDSDGTFTIGTRTDYTDATSGLARLDADARAGHAERRRLLGLRRAHDARRHSRPERSRHRLLPLRPHRHRQRRQHRLDHDDRQGRHDRPRRADVDAERHER